MSLFKNFNPAHFYKLIAIIMIVAGIVPWDEIFTLDIRTNTLLMLSGGGMFFIGLILLQFIYLIKAFLKQGRKVVFIILLVSGIAFSSFCLLTGTYFQPNVWQDKGIYQHNNSYIIVQFNSFGILGEHSVWRLIGTQNPGLPVRSISIIKSGYELRKALNLPEYSGDYTKPIPALKWSKKVWRLVKFD